MTAQETTARLKDGTTVQISLASCDRECISHGFDRLSVRSRHLRFFSPVNKLSEAVLSYLTEVDNVNHAVVAAHTGEGDAVRGIGLARYIRLKDEPETAEFAVTVIDEFQDRGAGSLLLDALVSIARENGLQVLRGYVLPSNTGMISLLEHRGARKSNPDDGSLQFDIDIVRDMA